MRIARHYIYILNLLSQIMYYKTHSGKNFQILFSIQIVCLFFYFMTMQFYRTSSLWTDNYLSFYSKELWSLVKAQSCFPLNYQRKRREYDKQIHINLIFINNKKILASSLNPLKSQVTHKNSLSQSYFQQGIFTKSIIKSICPTSTPSHQNYHKDQKQILKPPELPHKKSRRQHDAFFDKLDDFMIIENKYYELEEHLESFQKYDHNDCMKKVRSIEQKQFGYDGKSLFLD